MKRSYKILVIEDEPYWQEILKEILEAEGCRVKICEDFANAEDILSKELFHFATIDLRLLEDRMKSMNQSDEWGGWKILEKVKEESLNRTMGTMVISYYDEDYYKRKALKKHGSTFFMSKKTFKKTDFVRMLKNYLENYHDVHFYEGPLEYPRVTVPSKATLEHEKFEAAFYSMEGLKEFFQEKEKAGNKTIILFSDLIGSTRYKDERGFIPGLLKAFNHNAKVSKVIRRYGAKVVKTIGDCVMGRFDITKSNASKLATQAINAAIRINEVFADLNFGAPNELEEYKTKIALCVGVTGDTYMGDPHGLPVDIASRLLELAQPEQILINKELIEIADISQLESEILGVKSMGLKPQSLVSEIVSRKLRGVSNPVEICEIKWDGKDRGIKNT